VPRKAEECQEATYAVQQNCGLFDHLVGTGEQRGWHIEAHRLRGLEVYHQIVLGRPLHRQVTRLLAFEDTIDVARGAPELVEEIRTVGDQTASSGKKPLGITAGNRCLTASAITRSR
jgi:hypothetical protein